MRRLRSPFLSAKEMFETCISGVHLNDFKNRLESATDELIMLAERYALDAASGKLFTVDPFQGGADDVVASGIYKREFLSLYSYYLRHPDKPGRAVYDKLLLAAEGKCPFCGGIGNPKNLDHFMPKAFFPQFSVIPANLVPSCRDCNMDGKGENFAGTEDGQVLHPYLDHDHFFNENWISARVITGLPCALEFFVCEPVYWSEIDKKRVAAHFRDFDLGKRYSVVASEELSTLISQRRNFMREYTPLDFKQYLASFLDAPFFANHWKIVMYRCLMNDEWFCNHDFE